MSFADPALAQMVAPVPEELLAGKLEKEQAAAAKGFRSFTRLETQERSLARKAQSKAPATKVLGCWVVCFQKGESGVLDWWLSVAGFLRLAPAV